MKALALVVLPIVILVGCAPTSKFVPVGLDQAVKGIEMDIRKLGYLSVSDLLGNNPSNLKSAATYIREKQCFFGKSNPMLVFALQSQMTFDLKGSFTQSGNFKISGIPSPEGEIGISTSSGTEQKITWPINLASLSALPEIYLDERTKILESKGLTNEHKDTLEKAIYDNYDKLKKIIQEYEDSFSNKQCHSSQQ